MQIQHVKTKAEPTYFFLSKTLKYWSYVNFLFICNYCSPTNLSERTSSFFQQNIYTTKIYQKNYYITSVYLLSWWFMQIADSFGISSRFKLTLRIDKFRLWWSKHAHLVEGLWCVNRTMNEVCVVLSVFCLPKSNENQRLILCSVGAHQSIAKRGTCKQTQSIYR